MRPGLRRALSNKPDGQSGRDRPGQLLSDLLDFRNNGGEKFTTRWDFSPELAKAGLTKQDIADEMMDLISNDDVIRENVRFALGFSQKPKGEFDKFLEKLENKAPNLFRIETFPNIRRALDL